MPYGRITINLEDQQIEALKEAATHSKIPVSVLVRSAVTEFLRKRSVRLSAPSIPTDSR